LNRKLNGGQTLLKITKKEKEKEKKAYSSYKWGNEKKRRKTIENASLLRSSIQPNMANDSVS